MYANSNHASLCFLYCSFIQHQSVHYYNHYVAFGSQENDHLWHNFKKSHIIFPGGQYGTQNNAYKQMSSNLQNFVDVEINTQLWNETAQSALVQKQVHNDAQMTAFSLQQSCVGTTSVLLFWCVRLPTVYMYIKKLPTVIRSKGHYTHS